MTTARDVMTGDATCIGAQETLVDAARKMSELDVGALPICGEDNRLKGMVTDRDIVVRCIAQGGDPSLQTMTQHSLLDRVVSADGHRLALGQVGRLGGRLPVIDGHELIGMVSQADIARNLSDDKIGMLVEAISSAPPNN